MSDTVITVRQIAQYPPAQAVAPADVLLLQQGGLGGPYASVTAPTILATALNLGGSINLAPGSAIAWNGAALTWDGTNGFTFSDSISASAVFADAIAVGGSPVVTEADLIDVVTSFNGRGGDVVLETDDILRAGGAPVADAHFSGFITAPTAWDFRANDDQVATTAWVQLVIGQLICGGSLVTSFNGRGGAVTLTTADVNAAYATMDGSVPTAPNPALGDASARIATTLFVDESLQDLQAWVESDFVTLGTLAGFAPLASPNFSGVPTAPTAATGVSTGQIATTAFVHAAVTASTTGVASFNTRTGAVVLLAADVTGVGGALLASPAFTGAPLAPTAVPGNSTTQIATTAFVAAAVTAAGGVTSFNTRTGPVVLSAADLTAAGGALAASPTFTGTPAAPTAAPGASTTQLATTAFVAAAAAAGVTSFMGRTGPVTLIANDISSAGGALLAGPIFTGVPAAPTAAPATSTTQIATTAFVAAALAAGGGVISFNGRAGAVTLGLADVTGAGGAPAASPALTGSPTAPTAAPGTSTTQIATTGFVAAASAPAAGNVGRNRLHNGAFRINQRGYASGTALAAAAYAHDRWKAGAGGCTYTFTQAQPSTAITITAGTLQQAVEDLDVEGGAYVLSWSGTATGRINAGGYAASPVTVTGLPADAVITVEFGVGTVGTVQLEPGSSPSPFERIGMSQDLAACQRYYETGSTIVWSGYVVSGMTAYVSQRFRVVKRAVPVMVYVDAGVASFPAGTPTAGSVDVDRFTVSKIANGGPGGGYFIFTFTASAEL
jgi:hypothetical protein